MNLRLVYQCLKAKHLNVLISSGPKYFKKAAKISFMKKIIFSVVLTLLCLNALTARAELDVVIGEDDRANAVATDYPYSTIGRISTKSGKFCTGFLVSKSVVMTNAHCLVDSENKLLDTSEVEFFLPSQNRSFSALRLKIAKKYLENSMMFDFAFIEVDEDAGHHSGYLGTRVFDSSIARQNNLQLAGFAVDYKLSLELFRQTKLCSAMQPSPEGLIMHTCDMQDGSSGAPIFIKKNESFYVVGINSRQSANGACAAFNDRSCFNLAVPFQQVGSELVEFQKNN